MASHQLRISAVDFIGEDKEIVRVAKPDILYDDLEHYHDWLATLVERVNEALQPALPGRSTKIEDPCVPEKYVLHFLASLLELTDEVVSPHSISYTCHRAVPYCVRAIRVNYRVHSLTALKNVLEVQQKVKLSPKVAFCHYEQVEDMTSYSGSTFSMKEKITRAKANATSLAYPEQIEQPLTSRIALVVSEGEGRSMREVEIIYWADLYKTTKSFKFQLRFFCPKIRATIMLFIIYYIQ
ncbi:Hypothetical predicted protein [Paramuricea clavata]|uniref:Uncharacterized protein n=1 Tax=Paramuricea clavata TaxID=317549 RepID=A0A6S7GCV1_PARCT|nr:Hypothetical predicted protein [Paramuricea clavata]